jgi:hypothetical protein
MPWIVVFSGAATAASSISSQASATLRRWRAGSARVATALAHPQRHELLASAAVAGRLQVGRISRPTTRHTARYRLRTINSGSS